MGKTKEVNIPEEYLKICKEEYEVDLPSSKVVLKRLLRGDIGKIQQECIKIKATANNVNADVQSSDFRDLTVVKSIVEAPWNVDDLNAFRQLPPLVADFVEEEVKKFNTIEVKKKED